MSKTFNEFRRERQLKAGAKYLDEKGVNTALYARNNLIDILEELADAVNICDLMIERLSGKNIDLSDFVYQRNSLIEKGEKFLRWTKRFKDHFPQDVERLVDLEEKDHSREWTHRVGANQ
jgi:hypothetical protein